MGGGALFSGASYQQKAIAYVYVHMLCEAALNWSGLILDVPVAVSAETGGPGDDVGVEIGEGRRGFEIQAKHSLNAGKELDELLAKIRTRAGTSDECDVVVALGEKSTRTLFGELREDLERIRSGRTDALRADAKRLLTADPSVLPVLQRMRIVRLDVDALHEPHVVAALGMIRDLLEDASQAQSVWSVFVADATDICARRLRRNRQDIVELLVKHGIKLRPSRPLERIYRGLEFSKNLLNTHRPASAIDVLGQLSNELRDTKSDQTVSYRLHQHRATGLLHLGHLDDAVEAARIALDFRPDGVEALSIAALASHAKGDAAAAATYCEKAITVKPSSPKGWMAKTNIAMSHGLPQPEIPPEIATDAEYRNALAQLMGMLGESQRVLEITSKLLADGHRTPENLLLKARAVLACKAAGAVERRLELEDAERLSSEAADLFQGRSDPEAATALGIRAEARRQLGRKTEAELDLVTATEIAPESMDVLQLVAAWKYEEGDEEGALKLLQNPLVDRKPSMLAMRIELLVAQGENAEAKRDLERALQHILPGAFGDLQRVVLAEAALEASEPEIARRLLDEVVLTQEGNVHFALLKARLSLVESGTAFGVERYQEAAALHPSDADSILAELAGQLLRSGDVQEALKVYDQVGMANLPPRALRSYGAALMRAGDLVRANALVESVSKENALPEWALRIAIDLALFQEDIEAAKHHLEALGEQDIAAQLTLAGCYMELGDREQAIARLERVTEEREITPLERARTAGMLAQLGRSECSREQAFRAYRDSPGDPQIQRILISVALANGGYVRHVPEVGAGSHVVLHSEDGDTRSHSIFESGPIDPQRNEITLESAEKIGLVGKKVGEKLEADPSDWSRPSWTIVEVVPAIVAVVRDVMENYEQRFPDEPFFLRKFKFDSESVRAFVPLIGSIENRKERSERILQHAKKNVLPFGWVAQVLGGSIAEVMKTIQGDREAYGPLWVEWSDVASRLKSQAAASSGSTLVLTRSALETISLLKLGERLVANYSLIAPRSLRTELQAELAEAERCVTEGQHVGTCEEGLVRLHELPAGHPALVARRDRVAEMLAWIAEHVTLKLRSLTSADPDDDERRNLIGRSSQDALVLAAEGSGTLYADDLGLRRFLDPSRSCSTIGILRAMTQEGVLSAETQAHILTQIIPLGYSQIQVTPTLLSVAVREREDLGTTAVRDIFNLLSLSTRSIREAAGTGAEALRMLMTATIQVIDLSAGVRMVLKAMCERWEPEESSKALVGAASRCFALLPRDLSVIEQTAIEFAKSDGALVGRPAGN